MNSKMVKFRLNDNIIRLKQLAETETWVVNNKKFFSHHYQTVLDNMRNEGKFLIEEISKDIIDLS